MNCVSLKIIMQIPLNLMGCVHFTSHYQPWCLLNFGKLKWWLLSSECKRVWEENLVIYCKLLSQHWLETTLKEFMKPVTVFLQSEFCFYPSLALHLYIIYCHAHISSNFHCTKRLCTFSGFFRSVNKNVAATDVSSTGRSCVLTKFWSYIWSSLQSSRSSTATSQFR